MTLLINDVIPMATRQESFPGRARRGCQWRKRLVEEVLSEGGGGEEPALPIFLGVRIKGGDEMGF